MVKFGEVRTMQLDRRRFLQSGSLAGMALAAGMGAVRAGTRDSGPKPGEKAYADRVAFICWPNDVCLEPRPLENWPEMVDRP